MIMGGGVGVAVNNSLCIAFGWSSGHAATSHSGGCRALLEEPGGLAGPGFDLDPKLTRFDFNILDLDV